MSTLKELLAQRAALDAEITQMQQADRARAIGEVKALMAEHGITVMDLHTSRAPQASTSAVAPKFRNKDTGETWSGRGLKPRWLTAKLETGESLDSFRI